MTSTWKPGPLAEPRRWPGPAFRPSPGARPPGGRAVADGALFAFALVLGGTTLGYLWHSHGEILNWLDVALGTVACLTLWWRRSHPMPVFVLAIAAAAVSPLALGAALVAVCTAAARVRGRALAAVVVLAVAASVLFPLINPVAGEIVEIGFPAFLLTIIAFGWGLYLQVRRELVNSLRERARQLADDQQRNAEQAREAERRRIAREMHDVLAHRLSLLSVHAGALEFHPGAPPDEIAQAAEVIRTSAAAALGDLRQVITVLREDAAASDRPEPGFGELADLLAESRSAGMTLSEHIGLADAGDLPPALGRTAYRVVQEGLTNARKHAPGAPVRVAVCAGGGTLQVEVVNLRAPGLAQPAPAGTGAGVGLAGLEERVALAGGRLEHGPNAIGDFVLRATIPGPP